MAKQDKTFGYNDPFPTRFRNLCDEWEKTRVELAEEFNVTRQTITNWQTGFTVPDSKNLRDIARYFGVTTDYILGLTEIKTLNNLDVREISDCTGLSEKAVQALKRLHNCNDESHEHKLLVGLTAFLENYCNQ